MLIACVACNGTGQHSPPHSPPIEYVLLDQGTREQSESVLPYKELFEAHWGQLRDIFHGLPRDDRGIPGLDEIAPDTVCALGYALIEASVLAGAKVRQAPVHQSTYWAGVAEDIEMEARKMAVRARDRAAEYAEQVVRETSADDKPLTRAVAMVHAVMLHLKANDRGRARELAAEYLATTPEPWAARKLEAFLHDTRQPATGAEFLGAAKEHAPIDPARLETMIGILEPADNQPSGNSGQLESGPHTCRHGMVGCLMPGPHTADECHDIAMYEEYHSQFNPQWQSEVPAFDVSAFLVYDPTTEPSIRFLRWPDDPRARIALGNYLSVQAKELRYQFLVLPHIPEPNQC